MSTPEPWDDDIADACALMEALARRGPDEAECVRAILRHGNEFGIAITLAKALAFLLERAEAENYPPGMLRRLISGTANLP